MTSSDPRWPAGILMAGMLCAACAPPPPRMPEEPVQPVRSEVLEARPFRPTLTLLGRVRPAQSWDLVAEVEGRIDYPERFERGLRTGEAVAAGEVVARLHNPALLAAAAEQRLHAAAADQELERVRQALEAGIAPRVELQRAEVAARIAGERLAASGVQVDKLLIHSPGAGRLSVERALSAGTHVQKGTILARTVVADELRVECQATAGEAPRLSPGLEVDLLDGGRDEVIGRGRLEEVAPVVDEWGTVRVVACVTDDLGLPAPGRGLEVRVLLPVRPDVLTLPERALIPSAQGGVAFVLEPYGRGFKARRVVVRTGDRSGGRIEVRAGLLAGERVAVAGVGALRDGARASEVAPAPAANKTSDAIALETGDGGTR